VEIAFLFMWYILVV